MAMREENMKSERTFWPKEKCPFYFVLKEIVRRDNPVGSVCLHKCMCMNVYTHALVHCLSTEPRNFISKYMLKRITVVFKIARVRKGKISK